MSMKVNRDSMTDSLEDSVNVSMLLELYAPLLTERQRECVTLYFDEDLSLAEIAELNGITRQGVRDCIKKSLSILHDTEEKLGLLAKREVEESKHRRIVDMLTQLSKAHPDISDELGTILNAFEANTT